MRASPPLQLPAWRAGVYPRRCGRVWGRGHRHQVARHQGPQAVVEGCGGSGEQLWSARACSCLLGCCCALCCPCLLQPACLAVPCLSRVRRGCLAAAVGCYPCGTNKLSDGRAHTHLKTLSSKAPGWRTPTHPRTLAKPACLLSLPPTPSPRGARQGAGGCSQLSRPLGGRPHETTCPESGSSRGVLRSAQAS